MDLSERLELLVNMDPSQAVSAVRNIATETDRSMTTAESALKRFSSAGLKLGVAGIGVGGFLTQAASSDIEAAHQLQAAITQTGHTIDDYKDRLDAAIAKGVEFGHSDEEVTNAMSTLTLSYNDAGKALDQMQLVSDLAARKHITLGEAANIVAKAHGGAGRVFKEFGIEVDANAKNTGRYDQALSVLAQKLQGQASAAADSWGGRLRSLRAEVENQVSEFGQKYGPAILLVSSGMTVLSSVTSTLGSALNWLKDRRVADVAATEAEVLANTELAASEGLSTTAMFGVAGAVAAVAAAAYIGSQNAEKLTYDINGMADAAGKLQGAELDRYVARVSQIMDLGGKSAHDFGAEMATTSVGAANAFADSLDRQGHSSTEFRQGISDAAAALEHQKQITDNSTSANDRNTKSIEEQDKALAAREKTRHTEVDSVRSLYDAERTYTQSQRGVVDALRTVEDAQNRVIDAQKRLNDALTPASKDDVSKANLDISDAQLQVGDSADAVAQAEKDLEEIRAKGGTPEQIATAERKLAEARNNHERSIIGVRDAEARLQDVQKKGSEQDQQVIDARKNLTAAEQGVIDAKDGLVNAYNTEFTAAQNFKKAQDELYGGTQSANEAIAGQIEYLKSLAAVSNDPALTAFLDRLIALKPVDLSGGTDVNLAGNRNTPSFDSGGIVPGPRGRPMLAIVHGGEYVDKNGYGSRGQSGGDVNVHIYSATDADEQQRAAVRYWREQGMLKDVG